MYITNDIHNIHMYIYAKCLCMHVCGKKHALYCMQTVEMREKKIKWKVFKREREKVTNNIIYLKMALIVSFGQTDEREIEK